MAHSWLSSKGGERVRAREGADIRPARAAVTRSRSGESGRRRARSAPSPCWKTARPFASGCRDAPHVGGRAQRGRRSLGGRGGGHAAAPRGAWTAALGSPGSRHPRGGQAALRVRTASARAAATGAGTCPCLLRSSAHLRQRSLEGDTLEKHARREGEVRVRFVRASARVRLARPEGGWGSD